jgi:glutamate/aspartate transport system permease protein
MNIFKNASIAVAVGITELIFMAQQIAEETAKPTEAYFAVTLMFFISAMLINRIMAFIEKAVRVPGFVANTGGGH